MVPTSQNSLVTVTLNKTVALLHIILTATSGIFWILAGQTMVARQPEIAEMGIYVSKVLRQPFIRGVELACC